MPPTTANSLLGILLTSTTGGQKHANSNAHQTSTLPTSIQLAIITTPANAAEEEDIFGGGVWLLSQPAQAVIIAFILSITVIANVLVIINMSCSELKRKTVNFVLIKHLCIVDLAGALFVLPVPLVTTIKGKSEFLFWPENLC